MNKILFVITLLLFSLTIYGSEKNNPKLKVAIIVSLNEKEGKAYLNRSSYDVNERIEKEFSKYLDKNTFELIVIKNATLATVWKTLHDRSVYGVFFVGHAALQGKNGNPFAAPSLIVDRNLFNLKNVFQSVHSNLRYLAFISCNAKEIIQSFIDKGYYDNSPALKVIAFDKKIGLAEGVREILFNKNNPLVEHKDYDELFPMTGPCRLDDIQTAFAYEHCKKNALFYIKLKANTNVFKQTFNEPEHEENLSLTRVLPEEVIAQNIQSTLVLVNNRVVGFFDQGNPGATQTISIHLVDSELRNKISIVNDSGAPSTRLKSETILGELILGSAYNTCELNGKINSQGQLLGIGKNIYDLHCP